MKKLLGFLGLLFLAYPAFATGGASDSITVSSGTYKAIDLYTNANGNARQVAVIGDPVSTQAMKVDTSSSAYVNVSEVGGTAVSAFGGSPTVNISTSIGAASATTPLVYVSTFANVAASATGQVLVSSVTSTVLRIVSVACVTGGTATNVTFNSGNTTAISPLFANAANGGFVLPLNPMGWFFTASGENLTITTGSGSTTGCLITYTKG